MSYHTISYSMVWCFSVYQLISFQGVERWMSVELTGFASGKSCSSKLRSAWGQS